MLLRSTDHGAVECMDLLPTQRRDRPVGVNARLEEDVLYVDVPDASHVPLLEEEATIGRWRGRGPSGYGVSKHLHNAVT